MKEQKDRKLYYGMAAALTGILALFALFINSYIQTFNKTLMEENQVHLAELADHTVIYVNSVIENMQCSLENAAEAVAMLPEEKKICYLSGVAGRQGFVFIGHAGQDGFLCATDPSQNAYISKESYYVEAMNGTRAVTNLMRKLLTSSAVSGIMLAVPIQDESERPVGVLAAMLDISMLNKALTVESYGGEGYSYIIDGSGNLVLQNKSMDYNNFYRVLDNVKIKNGRNLEQIKADIANGNSGMIEYEQLGMNRYAYFCPLGLNSWTVVNIVSKEVITKKTDALTVGLVFISVSSFVIFALLFVLAGLSWINSQNQRHAAETKTAFLANVSHEIRTPMNAIVGMSDILLRGSLEQRQRECIQCIKDSGKSLLAIINDILDISKIESGKFSISDEEYDMKKLLSDITAIAVTRIGDKPIRFWLDLDETVPEHLIGDETRLRQILINLIGNAVKFTEEGDIRLALRTEEKEEDLYLRMEIIDTGVGIREQDMGKLFESFSRVDAYKNRSKEGTGLGLAISRSLSEMMGGTISVSSEFGKGSVFTVTVKQKSCDGLPLIKYGCSEHESILLLEKEEKLREYCELCLKRMNLSYQICTDAEDLANRLSMGNFSCVLADRDIVQKLVSDGRRHKCRLGILVKQEEYLTVSDTDQYKTIFVPLFYIQISRLFAEHDSEAPEKEESKAEARRFFPLPKIRMLIVDDNQLNLEITEGLLEPYQMEVDCLQSGREAIDAVQSKDYDIILMDHMMPELDGLETLKEIRNLPDKKYKELPIIVLTANAAGGAREMFLKNGFNGFLEKPIDIEKVDETLEKWLRDLNEERSTSPEGITGQKI